jgi:hypothetical protein
MLFGCLCCLVVNVVWLLFVLFYVVFVCKCVLPPGDNPIAVNKYIISYHIITNDKWFRHSLNISVYYRHCYHYLCSLYNRSSDSVVKPITVNMSLYFLFLESRFIFSTKYIIVIIAIIYHYDDYDWYYKVKSYILSVSDFYPYKQSADLPLKDDT